MCANRINLESEKEIVLYPHDAELSSFVQNIVTIESIMFRIEVEMTRIPPDIKRLQIYLADAQSLQAELVNQAHRAHDIGGQEDPNVLRYKSMTSRVSLIVDSADKRIELAVLEGAKVQSELDAAYADGQARMDKLVAERRPDDDPVQFNAKLEAVTAENLARLAEIGKSATTRMFAAGAPPVPPVDTPKQSAEDEPMNERISALEKDMSVVKTDVAVIRSNYVTQKDLASEIGSVRTAVEGVRTDVAKMESTILRWFIATAFTIASLAFAAAKFIQ